MNNFHNLKIAINDQQPLDEVVKELERQGYKLVPVVANKKMLKAGYDAHNDFFFDGQVQDVYKAMIGAVDE